MAQPLKYTPPKSQTEQTAEEEWADLLETLHETETLRVLNGLVGQYEGVEETLLADLVDTPRGHRAIKNLSVLFNGLSDLGTDDLETVREGVGKGLRAARRSFAEAKDPPGLLRLALHLRDPDVRRALSGVLALLKALGRSLNENLDEEPMRPKEDALLVTDDNQVQS